MSKHHLDKGISTKLSQSTLTSRMADAHMECMELVKSILQAELSHFGDDIN